MPRFSNLLFHSFQFRLLAYLFVVGVIPLILATYLFYQHSSKGVEQESFNNAELLNEQIIRMVEQNLSLMDTLSQSIVSDYLTQQFMQRKSERDVTTESVMNHLKEVIDLHMRNVLWKE
jgi:hypothetical protein